MIQTKTSSRSYSAYVYVYDIVLYALWYTLWVGVCWMLMFIHDTDMMFIVDDIDKSQKTLVSYTVVYSVTSTAM